MKSAAEPKSPRRAVNISLSRDLVEKARAAGLNISAIAEAAVVRALTDAAQARFRDDIARGVQEHTAYVAEYGSFAAAVRTIEQEKLGNSVEPDDVA